MIRKLPEILFLVILVAILRHTGVHCFAQTDLGEALTNVSEDPDNPKNIEILGSWYYDHGNYASAKGLLEKAIHFGGTSDTLQLKYAKCLIELGDTAIAFGKVNSVIANNPKSGEAYLALADLEKKVGEYDKAIESVSKAMNSIPDNLKPYAKNLHGILLIQQKSTDKAKNQFATAIELDPKFLPSYRNLFRLQMTLGEHSEALKTAKSGIEASPGNIEFINAALSAYLAMGKGNAALKFIEKQESEHPKDDHIKAYKAQAYLADGDTVAGCKIFNRLLAAKEMDPLLTLYLDQVPCVNRHRLRAHQLRAGAKSHFNIREYGLALQYLNELLKISDNNANDYYMRAMIHLASGNSVSAQADLDNALKLEPKLTEALILQSVILFEQHDYVGFKQTLDFAEKNCPNANVYFNLGLFYRETKDYENAEANLLKAMKEGYEDLNALYTELSKLYFSMKKKEKGCSCLKMAILLGNSSAELDFVLECE